MRKIIYNEQTINNIRNYINDKHTIMETCNKFTIKPDTLKRVMRENNIQPYFKQSNKRNLISQDKVQLVCNLFLNTNNTLQDIVKESKLQYWEMQNILNDNFTEEQQKSRKRKLCSLSSVTKYSKYKGIIENGNGYLMCLKPDWYTGRIKSKYVFVHSVVMCEYLGITEIPKGFCVHHINGDKKDNDISNLALLSISAHSKLHSLENNLCKVQRLFKYEVGSND